jgi:hypothetical protein
MALVHLGHVLAAVLATIHALVLSGLASLAHLRHGHLALRRRWGHGRLSGGKRRSDQSHHVNLLSFSKE